MSTNPPRPSRLQPIAVAASDTPLMSVGRRMLSPSMLIASQGGVVKHGGSLRHGGAAATYPNSGKTSPLPAINSTPSSAISCSLPQDAAAITTAPSCTTVAASRSGLPIPSASAAALSTPQQRLLSTLSIAPTAVDQDDSDVEDEMAVMREAKTHKKYTGVPPLDDDLWQPSKALRSLLAFEMGIEEKTAFEEFMRCGRSKTTPALVINYFKHFMCSNSDLVRELRALPLSRIEDVVSVLPRTGTLSSNHFTRQVLEPLLGRHRFLEQDALALFDFFDNDSDGEADFRDICNGFVLLRSRDGPVVPVVHRCIMMLRPKMRNEARLALMTRLELLHLTNVLLSVLQEFVDHASAQTEALRKAIVSEVPPLSAKSPEVLQLRAQQADVRTLTQLMTDVRREVGVLMEMFACDRRGTFPYAEVRAQMLQSPAIINGVGLLKVPRDEDLYKSFLSEGYRSADVDDASTNREFKPSVREKSSLLCGLQSGSSKKGGAAARRQTFSKLTDTSRRPEEDDEEVIDKSRDAEEHDAPSYYSFRGMLYRRDEKSSPNSAAAFVTKAEYFLEDAFGKRLFSQRK